MQRQRKWAIGILLCIVAVLLAIWVGVAKDEKDGDRESLYENEDYGLGFWIMRSRKAIRGCTDRFMRMRNGCCSAFL